MERVRERERQRERETTNIDGQKKLKLYFSVSQNHQAVLEKRNQCNSSDKNLTQ